MEDKLRCKNYFDEFLSLDKNEIIPFRVSVHLLTCIKCRTAVRSIRLAERTLQHNVAKTITNEASASDPVVKAALKQIEEAGLTYPQAPIPHRVSFSGWVAGGVILALCLSAFPFTSMGEWASRVFADKFLIPFYIVTGLAVALYAVIFTGSNMDFFVKKINAVKKAFSPKEG